MLNADLAIAGGSEPQAGEAYAPIARLRKQFEDFLVLKVREIDEQRQARLYYHGSQWTKDQLVELQKRRQPAVTTPKLARKINGFVGLVERLRQDPKAYGRTQKEEAGAELCTAALRYAMDEQHFDAITPIATLNGAVDGVAGIAMGLEGGDTNTPGDYDISLDRVEPDTFFYDARSFKHDFSDARFMGLSKWMDMDDAIAQWPNKKAEIEALPNGGIEYTILSDRERKWYNTTLRQVRVVEHWYRNGDKWLYCFHIGFQKLEEGRSRFQDEKGKDICRFIMWRSFVDQDGDSYSFHRYMKPLVDEINQRRSKALHLLAMRRVIMEQGAVEDVEKMRRESVRPDGVIVVTPNLRLEFEDAKTLADMKAQLEMLQHAEQELENFGPNPALVGQGVEAKSGKAIQLLQQAGIAELGPFIINYRGWKIRVYRAVWNAIKQHWKAERWIRVTDAEGNQTPLPVNTPNDPETGQPQINPMTGLPIIFNQLGALDVDIIIDEGPDSITMMADALDTLQSAMANGTQIPAPAVIELLPLPDSYKKKIMGLIQQASQPSPEQQQQVMLQLKEMEAKINELQSKAMLNQAKAQSELQPEPQQPQTIEAGPSWAEIEETLASAYEKHASGKLKEAQTQKTLVDTALAPQAMAQKAAADRARVQTMQQRPQ